MSITVCLGRHESLPKYPLASNAPEVEVAQYILDRAPFEAQSNVRRRQYCDDVAFALLYVQILVARGHVELRVN